MLVNNLREQFEKEEGIPWTNSEGEPDLDYVLWLENKLIKLKEETK